MRGSRTRTRATSSPLASTARKRFSSRTQTPSATSIRTCCASSVLSLTRKRARHSASWRATASVSPPPERPASEPHAVCSANDRAACLPPPLPEGEGGGGGNRESDAAISSSTPPAASLEIDCEARNDRKVGVLGSAGGASLLVVFPSTIPRAPRSAMSHPMCDRPGTSQTCSRDIFLVGLPARACG